VDLAFTKLGGDLGTTNKDNEKSNRSDWLDKAEDDVLAFKK